MNREQALSWAKKIAALIHFGADVITQENWKQKELMSMLAFYLRCEGRDIGELDSNIQEILIFGSTARLRRGSRKVGDIDMMVLDNGCYSRYLAPKSRLPGDSGSPFLREKLSELFEMYLDFDISDPAIKAILKVPVDLHVLALQDIIDPLRQSELAKSHRDPRFFENAFSSILRFNRDTGNFDPIVFKDFLDDCKTRHLRR
jgi:hypothetical protein